jgi:hypothetical protein
MIYNIYVASQSFKRPDFKPFNRIEMWTVKGWNVSLNPILVSRQRNLFPGFFFFKKNSVQAYLAQKENEWKHMLQPGRARLLFFSHTKDWRNKSWFYICCIIFLHFEHGTIQIFISPKGISHGIISRTSPNI